MNKTRIILLIVLPLIMAFSCKKKKADPHVPPDVTFKTGGKFISGDCTKAKQDTFWVGITATKTEDDLRSYNASYAYDGAANTTTFFDYKLQPNEYESYSKDLQIITRNQNGNEKWVFTIVDRDGNLVQKTINITVQ
jgi:hypothetical protein